MTDFPYRPVSHNHERFLEKALNRKGFQEAYEDLGAENALDRERRSGRSVLDIPAHRSGRMLRGWSRSDLYDEMLER